MTNTTIAISKELKDEIKEFATKKETYSDIIERLLKSAKERQLQDLLMDTSNTIPIEDSLQKAKKKWQK